MQFYCPECEHKILPADLNITTDLAKCSNCGQVFKASTLPTTATASLSEVPKGGTILVEPGRAESVLLTLPAKGFKLAQLPFLFFAIFWIGFVAFWTYMASGASVLFAMFSIPFWLVGIMMIRGIFNGILEKQSLLLSADEIVFTKTRIPRTTTQRFKLSEIDSVGLSAISRQSFKMLGNVSMAQQYSKNKDSIDMPVITCNGKTVLFFEGATQAEQLWVTRLLRAMIKGRKV